jgi:hypothetical protein
VGALGRTRRRRRERGRLTAVDPLYPSPLVTVADLRVEMRAVPPGVAFAIRREDARPPVPASQVVCPAAQEYAETAYSSVVDRACFPDALHFLMDPKLQEPVLLHVERLLVARGKPRRCSRASSSTSCAPPGAPGRS